ncbi:MAG: DUF445 family protein [Planctomycetes bacterium]|nr:DUF445 family protein [Planctomycetota bacterium]MCL4730735.1 DUF445 family protein [Planctomycetota bacterium]
MEKTAPAADDTPTRGQRVLAVVGVTLSVLTLAGGACRFAFPDALWSELFFAVSISGLVGFATNWVAIKMLFHPRVRIMGVQGVVPSRRRELARSVGLTLEEHLISGDRMHKLLVDTGAIDGALDRLASHLPRVLEAPAARELVTREVADTIQATMSEVVLSAKDKLREKSRSNLTAILTGAAAATTFGPMAGMLAAGITKSGMFDTLVGKLIDDMVNDLKQDGGVARAAEQVVAQLPARAEHILGNPALRAKLQQQFGAVAEELLQAVDVAGLIERELLDRDEGELERLIDRVAANELCFIQVAGGGLGMVAGLALVWPWLILPIGLVFLVLVQVARSAERRHALARQAQSGPAVDRRQPAAPAPDPAPQPRPGEQPQPGPGVEAQPQPEPEPAA